LVWRISRHKKNDRIDSRHVVRFDCTLHAEALPQSEHKAVQDSLWYSWFRTGVYEFLPADKTAVRATDLLKLAGASFAVLSLVAQVHYAAALCLTRYILLFMPFSSGISCLSGHPLQG
jgi:hypothetical protein